MATVYLLFESSIGSSIFRVDMGSRADVGSSIGKDFRLHGQGPGDTKALLLSAGQSRADFFQPVRRPHPTEPLP